MALSVLIVEDEALLALTYQMALDDGGDCKVVGIADSAREAISMACEARPSVVLMDIKLKGAMDGIEAAEEIMKRVDTSIIYVTANADELTRKRAEMTRPKGYFNKPLACENLCDVIRTVVH